MKAATSTSSNSKKKTAQDDDNDDDDDESPEETFEDDSNSVEAVTSNAKPRAKLNGKAGASGQCLPVDRVTRLKCFSSR